MRAIIATPPEQPPGDSQPMIFVVDAVDGPGQRVDRYLADRLDGVSRTRLQQWMALGAVRCDERALVPAMRLKGGEHIVVEPQPREADTAFAPDPIDLNVLHEDDDLLVVDKPAGLVVHPAAGNWRGTLMNGLLHHRPALARLPRAGIVHRLDRETSGLLVVAKTERAFASLSAQLADRSMRRRYLALVVGAIGARGTVDAPIGRDPVSRVRMAVVDAERGKPARTHYERLSIGQLDARDVSLVECRLESGRTHQIRVHLRSIGHPLVGDALYGGLALGGFERQALHAWRLGLRHPAEDRTRQWRSSLPDDLRALCRAAGIELEAIEARE